MRGFYVCVLLCLAVSGTSLAVPCIDYGERAHWMGTISLPYWAYPDAQGRIVANGDVVYLTSTYYPGLACQFYTIDVSDGMAPVVTDSLDAYVFEAVIQGEYLYTACENSLTILDIADPRHPLIHSRLEFDQNVYCVKVKGTLAFLGTEWNRRVRVVDIGDPAHPSLLGEWDPGRYINSLSFVGDLGYIADGNLEVVDLSDPLHPSTVRTIDLPEDLTYGLAVGDGFAALQGGQTIYLYDISDPTEPIQITQMQSTIYGYHFITGLELVGDVLFQSGTNGAEAWKISRPWQVEYLGRLEFADGLKGMGFGPGRIYAVEDAITSTLRFAVMDFSSQRLDSGTTVLEYLGGAFVVEEDRLYTSVSGTLTIYDVTDPSSPFILGMCAGAGQGLEVEGDLAATPTASGIRLIDVSRPECPTSRGIIPRVRRIVAIGFASPDLLYVLDSDLDDLTPSILVYDVSDPDRPAPVSSISMPAGSRELHIDGDLAVVASYTQVVILDLTNPGDPRQMCSIHRGGTSAVGLYDRVLCASSVTGRIDVYDLAQPDSPRQRGSLQTFSLPSFFEFGDDLAYVGSGFNGGRIVELADLDAPRLVGAFSHTGVGKIQIDGDNAYYAGGWRLAVGPLQCASETAVAHDCEVAVPFAPTVYPNPFNPSVTIAFTAPSPQPVSITVHDVVGRRLATITSGELAAGRHEVRWNGRDDGGRAAPSGTYFFKVTGGAESQVVKGVLLK